MTPSERGPEGKHGFVSPGDQWARDRFWPMVGKPDPETGCLPWLGRLRGHGYGSMRLPGLNARQAHRIAWALRHGRVDDHVCILHRCDHPWCVNVEHLYAGTVRENNADRDAKGRQARGPTHQATVQRCVPRGAACTTTKRTYEDVKAIRDAVEAGESCLSVGRRLGICDATISKYARGKGLARSYGFTTSVSRPRGKRDTLTNLWPRAPHEDR